MVTGFILILAVLGQPERIVNAADTMAQCNAAGVKIAANYARIYHLEPRDIAYRCVPLGDNVYLPSRGDK
jgi:hypothetical protein